MKLIATFIVVLISSITCFSQVDTTAIPFVSYWSIGDSYDFKVTKIKKQWKEGELTKNDSSSYNVNFEVIDSTETSYTIKWSFENNLTGDFNIPEKFLEKFSKYKLTEVIYQTSEVGAFIGIKNWEELSVMMKGLFSDIIDVLSNENNIDREALNKTMEPLISIYNSKAGIEQLVFKELQYIHFPFGIEYSTSEPIFYEDQLPNMFGGKPIRGDVKIYFESVDFDNSFCVMIQEMKLNSDDTRGIILKLFKKMGLNDKDMKTAMKTAIFDITDYNRFEYYYYPGVPIKIVTTRRTNIDINKERAKRLDKTIIELID